MEIRRNGPVAFIGPVTSGEDDGRSAEITARTSARGSGNAASTNSTAGNRST